MNEIHDHKEELMSSNELLTNLPRSERSELHGKETGSNSIKETCATLQSFYHAKDHSYE